MQKYVFYEIHIFHVPDFFGSMCVHHSNMTYEYKIN